MIQNGYITSESDKNSPSEPTADYTDNMDYNLIADSMTRALSEQEDQTSFKDAKCIEQEDGPSPKGKDPNKSSIVNQKDTKTFLTQPVNNTQSNSDDSEVVGVAPRVTGGLAKSGSQGNGWSKGGDTSTSEGSGSSSKGGDTSGTSGLGESISTLHTEPSQEEVEGDTASLDSKPKSDESDEYSLSGEIGHGGCIDTIGYIFVPRHGADNCTGFY